MTEITFYRGMSKNNSSTVVNLTDSLGGQHEDRNELAGQALESTQYLGDGGPVESSTITAYYVSDPTATRPRSGLDPLTARWVVPAQTLTRQAVTSTTPTTWRITATTHSYLTSGDYRGLVQRTYSYTVPVDPDYDRCTTYAYAAVNPTKNCVGNWVWEHRGAIATGIAVGACLVPGAGWAVCAGAQALAFAVRTSETVEEKGFDAGRNEIIADGFFTLIGGLGGSALLHRGSSSGSRGGRCSNRAGP